MDVKSTVDEIVGDAQQVQSFWRRLFGAKPARSDATQPVAKKKEKYVAVDETKVMLSIVEQLNTFFRLQEQLATHIRVEEERSKSVYDPSANLMEAALKRIVAQDQMAALEVEIRECMVYNAPKEMGALYSRMFETKAIIAAEQEEARLREESKERYKSWRRREAKRRFLLKEAYLAGTAVVLLYIWMWLLYIRK
jgi:hypothetical protein